MVSPQLHIGVLNLMHDKADTQRRFVKVLRQPGFNVTVTFLYPRTHYRDRPVPSLVQQISQPLDLNGLATFDAFIITGAPIEQLPFDKITYLDEVHQLIDRLVELKIPQLYICWGAMVAANYLYGIDKRKLPAKLFGIFRNYFTANRSTLLAGLPDGFLAPHARYAELDYQQVVANPHLAIEAVTLDRRLFFFRARDSNQYFLFSHLEYGRQALLKEYLRERNAHPGYDYLKPQHYFADPLHMRGPQFKWAPAQHIFFNNWLHQVNQHAQAKQLIKE